MSSASWSASSRYCVVRMRSCRRATSSRSMSQRSPRLRGSSPVVGSSRNSTSGAATGWRRGRAGGACRPRTSSRAATAASVRSKRSSSSSARCAASRFEQVVQAADHHEVLPRAQQPVDGGLLGGDADASAHRAGWSTTSKPATRAPALGRRRERGQDADGGGLAGAVVAEQAEHRARGDVEVEVAQRPQVAEPLAEAVGGDTGMPTGSRHGPQRPVVVLVCCTMVSYIVRRS